MKQHHIAILAALTLSAGSLKAGDWQWQLEQQRRQQTEDSQRFLDRWQEQSQRESDRFNDDLDRQRYENERRVRDMQEDCDW